MRDNQGRVSPSAPSGAWHKIPGRRRPSFSEKREEEHIVSTILRQAGVTAVLNGGGIHRYCE